MIKLFFFYPVLLILVFSTLLNPNVLEAVYYATDSVSIYRNNKQIKNDSVIFVTSDKSSKRCVGGICLISQQYYPVTFYKAKDNNTLLTSVEFNYQHPYRGDEYYYPAKDGWSRWNAENKEKYLKYLNENSNYLILFNPGPSGGGEGCGDMWCLGGRIGDDRFFIFDITSGDYKQISDPQNDRGLLSVQNILDFSTLAIIILLFLLFYFIKKRKKI